MGKPISIRIRKYLNEKDHFEPYVEVLDVDALRQEELPHEYMLGRQDRKFECFPCCRYFDYNAVYNSKPVPALMVHDKDGRELLWLLVSTKHYRREEFMKLLDIVRECAARLSKVKRQLSNQEEKNKKKYADWTGEEEITI
jgi:hypothetical protein